MQKITPFLWFNTEAVEAARFYTSIFKNSKIHTTTYYESEGANVSGMPAGSVMTVEFSLNGQQFVALNGGPQFTFTEAISFVINCEDQEEVDYYWEKLSEEGTELPCGWVKDKYGVAWQVTPVQLTKILAQGDPKHIHKAMNAMLKMKKIIIKDIEKALTQ